MPTLLADEINRIADSTLEVGIAALQARNNTMNRSGAVRLLTKRLMRIRNGGQRLPFIRGKNPTDAVLAPAAAGDA